MTKQHIYKEICSVKVLLKQHLTIKNQLAIIDIQDKLIKTQEEFISKLLK